MSSIAIDAMVIGRGHTGFGRYVTLLARYLPEMLPDHKIHLIVGKAVASSCSMSRADVPEYLGVPRAPSPVIHQVYIPALLRKHRIELCHFTTNVGPILRSRRSVVTVHDTRQLHRSFPQATPWKDRLLDRYSRVVVPAFARDAAAVITDDSETKRELVMRWGVPEHKVHVILLGLDEDRFHVMPMEQGADGLRERYSLSPGYLLSVGSPDARKNTTGVLAAYAALPQGLRKQHPLVVVWAAESSRSYADALVTSVAGADSGVRSVFAPSDTDLALLYNGARAFVSATLYPGAYLPPLEAMACGAPVVLSRYSYVEAFEGFTREIDPSDTVGLTAALEEVMTDSRVAASLRKRGLERAAALRARSMAFRTAQVYSAVLGE